MGPCPGDVGFAFSPQCVSINVCLHLCCHVLRRRDIEAGTLALLFELQERLSVGKIGCRPRHSASPTPSGDTHRNRRSSTYPAKWSLASSPSLALDGGVRLERPMDQQGRRIVRDATPAVLFAAHAC